MSHDALSLFFRAGVFLALASLVLVLAAPRESASFVVSVCSMMIGLALIALVLVVGRLMK